MSRLNSDRLFSWSLRGSAALCALIVLLIAAFLVRESYPALRHVGAGRFFADGSWHPEAHAADGVFNLVPMIWGTVTATAGAVLIAAPLAVLCAVFRHYYAPPKLARRFRSMIELLAGIPSVVYGLWGLVVLVPLIRRMHPPGPSLLSGIMILALMILPTIALAADAAIGAVPRSYLYAASATALSRRATVWHVVLPAARTGLLTGVILGTGRAIGETMAMLMVCGNIVRTPHSLFDPIRTLTANIALEMGFALGDHRSALFVSGAVLLLMIVVLLVVAEVLSKGRIHA